MHRTASLAFCLAMTAGAVVAAPTVKPVVLPLPPAVLPAPTLDERLACGVLFLSVGDLSQRFPEMFGGMTAQKRDTVTGMIRMMGVSGAQMYDRAMAEGAAAGRTPSQLYSTGMGHILASFDGVAPKDREAAGERGKALFMRCMAIVGA